MADKLLSDADQATAATAYNGLETKLAAALRHLKTGHPNHAKAVLVAAETQRAGLETLIANLPADPD